MITAVGDGITSVIGWVGEVVTALIGENGALAPLLSLFAIGIAVSGVLFGIKVIRGLIWGA